jgi:hypothetical protein
MNKQLICEVYEASQLKRAWSGQRSADFGEIAVQSRLDFMLKSCWYPLEGGPCAQSELLLKQLGLTFRYSGHLTHCPNLRFAQNRTARQMPLN